MLGPYATEAEARVAIEVAARTFSAEAELAGSGARWWVVMSWPGGKREKEWIGKFDAYVAGYLAAWKEKRC